jgi:hypothetical protein
LSVTSIDCDNIWIFLRQGAHHDAQKSTIVTFPKLPKRNDFPSGLGAENLKFILCLQLAVAPAAGELISVVLLYRDSSFSAFKDSSKPQKSFLFF